MHRHQRTGPTRRRQHAQEFAVIEMRRLVGEEHLQAAHARRDHFGDFIAHNAVRGVGDDLVEAVIHHRLLRSAVILGQCVADAVTLELRGEADDRGGAAGQARRAAGDEALLIRAAVRAQLLDVAVRIDPARQHQQAAGIQHLCAFQLLAQRGDAAVADADIGAESVGRGHHGAATDHQFEFCHLVPSLVALGEIGHGAALCA